MTEKVALVTGGSSGIGRATAIAFGKVGANVVVAARREAEGEETVKLIRESGGEGLFVKVDVTKAADVEAMINKVIETYGRLDYAFNNAGSGNAGAIVDLSEADWDYLIQICCQDSGAKQMRSLSSTYDYAFFGYYYLRLKEHNNQYENSICCHRSCTDRKSWGDGGCCRGVA